jgi:hypothetical protein
MNVNTNHDPPKTPPSDRRFPRDQNVQLKVDKPFKRAIRSIAFEIGISMNDLIRQAVRTYLEDTYPGYKDLYNRMLTEEINKDFYRKVLLTEETRKEDGKHDR